MKFNPDVPDVQSPDYSKDAKSITSIGANSSQEDLLKGVAGFLTNATKGYDAVRTEQFNQAVQDQLEPLNQADITGLENQRNAVYGSPQPKAQAPEQGPTVTGDVVGAGQGSGQRLEGGDASQPNETIQQGFKTYEGLQSMRANGKISETDFLAKKMQILKNLRGQFPDQASTVDAMFKNTANQYRTSLTADINAAVNRHDTDEKEMWQLVKEAGPSDPAGASVMGKRMAAGIANKYEVLNWYSHVKFIDADLGRRAAIRNELKGQEGDRADATTKDATVDVDNTVALASKTFMLADNSGKNVEGAERLRRAQTGEEPLTGPQALQAAQALSAHIQQTKDTIWARWSKPVEHRDQNGKTFYTSMVTDMGGEQKSRALLEEGLKPLYSQRDSLAQGDLSQAAADDRAVQAINVDTQRRLFTPGNRDVAAYFRLMSALKKIDPTMTTDTIKTMLGQSDVNMSDELKTYITQDKLRMFTQEDGTARPDPRKTQAIKSLIEEAKIKGITAPGYFREIIESGPKAITNKGATDQVKANAIRAFFDPANSGVLDNFKLDGKDSQGKPIRGKYAAFRMLTSPEVTKEIRRLSQQDPYLWKQYKDWSENEFQAKLFNHEIQALKDIQLHQDVKLTWDNTNKQFGIDIGRNRNVNLRDLARFGEGTPDDLSRYVYSGNQNQLANFSSMINRINGGLTNMRSIAEAEGKSVDAYAMQLILETDPSLQKTPIIEEMRKALSVPAPVKKKSA